MSKEELAKKVTALVAMTYKHAYALGQANPSEETIEKICKLYADWEISDDFIADVDYIKQHWNDE